MEKLTKLHANKAGYMVSKVACWWAGIVIKRLTMPQGRSGNTIEKVKFDGGVDVWTKQVESHARY